MSSQGSLKVKTGGCDPVVALVVRNPPVNAGDVRDVVSILGSGRSPGGGHGNHSSIPAWRIPWTEEPGGLQSMGSQRVWHDWSNLAQHSIAHNQLTLRRGRSLWIIWVGPMSSQGSLKVETGGRIERPRDTAACGLSLTLMALKMEEDSKGQGIQATSVS